MPHLNRDALHDYIDLPMFHSTVGFWYPSADSGRFRLAMGYRYFLPDSLSPIHRFCSGFRYLCNIAARRIGIVATNSTRAERQIPIAP